jgi:hypothetical protein
MQERSTRTTASVGSRSVGSGTFSTRTSPAPYIRVARMIPSDHSRLSERDTDVLALPLDSKEPGGRAFRFSFCG